jgi:8-amino-7-oxononanoate synthase
VSLSLALPHGGPRLVANARVDAVPTAAEVETDGSRLLNASADDVLGLATDTRVKEAAASAIKRFGLEVSRSSTLVAQLESRLAARLKADAAALVDSLATVLRALEQADATRLVDARLARGAGVSGLPFVSPEHLAQRLSETTGERLILIDGLRLLEGDLAPLPRLFEFAQRAHVPVVVFDALGPGPLGASGMGVLEHFELSGQVDLTVSALGTGAVVAGVRAVVDAFVPFLATRVSSGATAGAIKRLELMEAEPQRRARALDLAQQTLEALRARAFDTGPSVTPIVPVWLGDEGLTDMWLRTLAESGIFARGLLDGPRSRLLFSIPATWTEAQSGVFVDALEKTARKLGAPPPLGAEASRSVTVARPGTFASSTPCLPRWLPPALPTTPTVINDGRSVRERVFDTVETLTWRLASGQSGQLRKLPGAQTLRALVDRARDKG